MAGVRWRRGGFVGWDDFWGEVARDVSGARSRAAPEGLPVSGALP